MPIKVLYFVHTYGEKNGISLHLRQLISNLPPEISAQIIHARPDFAVPFFSSLRLPLLETLQALNSDFDIIHIHGYGNFCSFFGAIISFMKRKPLVWTIHGYPRISGPRRLLYYFYRYFMAPMISARASRIISVSADAARMLKAETKKLAESIPNGIDTDFFKPSSSYRDAKRICYVGRLDADKGLERMLGIKTHDVAFIGPDESKMRGRLSAMAAQMGINASFEEVPFEQMPAKYESCRYVVLPSKYEGFPLTLLESIAMGRPFISTDVGEVAQVLSELFESPGDFILSGPLQDKIKELEKKDLSVALALARKRLEKYSWKETAAKTAKIYAGECGKGR